MRLIFLSLVASLAMPACGGGGGGGSSPANPDMQRVIVVNSASGLTLTEVFLDAFEDGNIINQYASISHALNVTSGQAQALNQSDVDALYAALPGPINVQVVMDSFVKHRGGIATALNLTGLDLRWAPSEGDYIFQVVPNPHYPATEPDDPYSVVKLSEAQYQQMLSSGAVTEVSP